MNECPKCKLLIELFSTAEQTNRNYWIVTELFVFMHDGKDYCDYKNEKEVIK